MRGYAYLSAITVDESGQQPKTNNTRLNSVPRHSFNLTARYRMHSSLSGSELTGGLRAEGSCYTYGYDLPGYVVADAGGVRNAVALGDGRTSLLTVAFRH